MCSKKFIFFVQELYCKCLKNRSISRVLLNSIIYLVLLSPKESSNLPSGIERAALKLRFIWFFNSQGLPEIAVANYFRELLPHVFTITTHCWVAVIFCGTCCLPNCFEILPVRKWDALCCPDFPLFFRRRTAIERPVSYKGSENKLVNYNFGSTKAIFAVRCIKVLQVFIR